MHLWCNFITHFPGIRVGICMNVKKLGRLGFNRQSIIKTPTYCNEKTPETRDRLRQESIKKRRINGDDDKGAWPGELQSQYISGLSDQHPALILKVLQLLVRSETCTTIRIELGYFITFYFILTYFICYIR